MKGLPIILLLFLALNLFGQNQLDEVVISNDSDTTFWAQYHLLIIKKLDLISPASHIKYLRISSAKYFLELTKDSAKVTFYAHEIWDSKQTGESFIKSYPLDKIQLLKIYQLYDSLEINKIPSDKFIKKWKHGFDGITYILERKIETMYSFKNYWTPSIQENFYESQRILNFTTAIDTIIDYREKRKIFESEIPFYGWSFNGSMVTMRIVSNTKQYRKYKRMKRKQLKARE